MKETMTTPIVAALTLLGLWTLPASAQTRIGAARAPEAYALSTEISAIALPEFPAGQKSGGKKDDPAYRLYKQGYDLILDERWEEAGKKLTEVTKQYPKSAYVDDAEYWSAYALMHVDKRKAVTAYAKFIDRRPSSKYYNDAIADLSDLTTTPVPAPFARAGRSTAVPVPDADTGWSTTVVSGEPGHLYLLDSSGGHGSGFVHSSESSVVRSLNKIMRGGVMRGYSYSFGKGSARNLSRALEEQGRTLRSIRLPSSAHAPRAILAPGFFRSDEDLDEETKLKLEALEALGSENEDSASFRALREIVLDRSKKRRLRTAAMEQLVDFKKFDPLPVFLEVAKSDTGQEVQNSAIDYIGMLTKDKNRSVETLIELFYAIPESRADQRENIFYSIAEVGNDRAVDFLAKIAQTDEKYDLRREAVYYLGSIGSARSRAALVEVLKQK